MNIVEAIRAESLAHQLGKLGATWPERRKVLLDPLRGNPGPSPRELLGVGDKLSEAFLLPSFANQRGQSELSGGGSTWEALVSFYLNLCYAGTSAVALSGRFVPACLKDALRVTYLNNPASKLNADIDILLVSCPPATKVHGTGNVTKTFAKLVEAHFDQTSIVLIQTKTNWNDSAQVPMLWNMVYGLAADGKLPTGSYTVGAGAFHPLQLASFTYAFVTVPTQKNLASFKPTSMAVARVSSMSGGAYWGRPTKPGVISSITEFFNFNYGRSGNLLPAPSEMGQGVSAELKERNGRISLSALDFLP